MFGLLSSALKSGIYDMHYCVAEAGSKKRHKRKGKDGKTMFRILPCASSVINPDSQAVLCPTVAGLLAP